MNKETSKTTVRMLAYTMKKKPIAQTTTHKVQNYLNGAIAKKDVKKRTIKTK